MYVVYILYWGTWMKIDSKWDHRYIKFPRSDTSHFWYCSKCLVLRDNFSTCYCLVLRWKTNNFWSADDGEKAKVWTGAVFSTSFSFSLLISRKGFLFSRVGYIVQKKIPTRVVQNARSAREKVTHLKRDSRPVRYIDRALSCLGDRFPFFLPVQLNVTRDFV